MRKLIHQMRFMSALLPLSLCCATASHAQLPSTPPSHVVILILENYAYSDIIGTAPAAYAPHINALCADTNAAVFTQFYAITHPSEPNYLQMFSGDNQGVVDDGVPSSYPFTTPNLAAELIAAGKTFTTYSEDLPSVGFDGATYTSGGTNYARKHNPVTNWVNTGTLGANQLPPSVNQPYTSFPSAANYSTLPTICYVVPNMTNDMHDGTWPSNITLGDTWTYNHLDSLRQWALTNNTLYIITFDEDDDLHGNNIPTIFYGPMVKGGTYTENVNLYSLLRTLEDLYGLGHAGAAATNPAILDCWKSTPISTGVTSITNDHSIKVMPNPASDAINFESSNVNEEVTITIMDEMGRIAGKYTMTGGHLHVNTSAFAAGAYSFKTTSKTNNVLDEGKFVVAHN